MPTSYKLSSVFQDWFHWFLESLGASSKWVPYKIAAPRLGWNSPLDAKGLLGALDIRGVFPKTHSS